MNFPREGEDYTPNLRRIFPADLFKGQQMVPLTSMRPSKL
jgi:hypothetical protein